MRAEKIAEIVGAKIPEEKMDVEIGGVTVDQSETEAGELCFVEEREGCVEALERHASMVVTCKDNAALFPESDSLIAGVEDVAAAALRFAGHIVDEQDVSITCLDTKAVTFLDMILKHKKSVGFLSGAWQDAFDKVMASETPLLVTDNALFYEALRPGKKRFDQKAKGYVVSADSLFRTTFKIDRYIYQYKPLTHLHLPALQRAIAFCEAYELPYTLEQLRYTKHLMPIFLEGEPSVQEVMKSDKVVILSDNAEDIVSARAYAADIGSWMAKTVVMLPHKTKMEDVRYPTYYRSEEEILSAIESLNFHYLFIYMPDEKMQKRLKERLGQRG